MHKENVTYIRVYTHTHTDTIQINIYTQYGILFCLNKEGNPFACNDINKPARHYAEWNKTSTTWYFLYVELKKKVELENKE